MAHDLATHTGWILGQKSRRISRRAAPMELSRKRVQMRGLWSSVVRGMSATTKDDKPDDETQCMMTATSHSFDASITSSPTPSAQAEQAPPAKSLEEVPSKLTSSLNSIKQGFLHVFSPSTKDFPPPVRSTGSPKSSTSASPPAASTPLSGSPPPASKVPAEADAADRHPARRWRLCSRADARVERAR